MNTNDNFRQDGRKIPRSGDPEEHSQYVWKKYVERSNAQSILIVAHSYGGVLTLALINEMPKEFEKRVKGVAFTDSVHCFSQYDIPKYLKQVC